MSKGQLTLKEIRDMEKKIADICRDKHTWTYLPIGLKHCAKCRMFWGKDEI